MPPRRQSAPKGETRTGLVVALVFFILTTITLGVVSYMGYDGQKALEDTATAAKKDVDKANEAEREAKARLLAWQVMMGGTNAADKADALGQVNANEKFRSELASIIAAFKPYNIDWDEKSATPTRSVFNALKDLTQQKEVADNNVKTALNEAEVAKNDYTQKSATQEAKVKTSNEQNQISANLALDMQKQAEEAKKTAINEINTLSAKLKDLQQNKDNMEADLNSKKKKLEEEIASARETLVKLQREQDARRTQLLLTDKVVGRVTNVDGVSGIAYINLGSADYVRPGMTFSILMKYDASRFGVEDPLPKKATLVVNQIITEHSSRASIEFDPQINPIQDPVEVGDGLYKPGWKPGTPVRWALAGHFDLNGLGRDETELLKTRLKKEGIVVDAYLDLNTLKVVGELNSGIDYLIVGNRPTGETARVIGENRKKAIEDAMNNMIESAKGMGITVMQGRVFLPVFGIDLPRNRALPFFPGGGPGGAPTGDSDKADKGDKKDEGK